MLDPQLLSGQIKNKSSELGFQHCGIAKVRSLIEHQDPLKKWLQSGHNAGMEYMNQNFEKRLDPSLLVDGARSLIIVALNYYQPNRIETSNPQFSKYAYGYDYHKVLKDKLYLLLEFIRSKSIDTAGRVFVDSAPILERAWAVESGLGWIGKNSMLITKESGSFVFLGTLVINQDLDYDIPEAKEYCGSCTRCIDACPTTAITPSRRVDSRRCISYLSIEEKEDFSDDDNISLHGNIFGCDICQDVCPWNKKADETKESAFNIFPEIRDLTYKDWEKIEEDRFNSIFLNSPVKRTGFKNFKRNLKKL